MKESSRQSEPFAQQTNMPSIPGTTGYRESASQFIEVSQALRFEQVNAVFLDYLPASPSRILDAGAGAGQNAAALVDMGHTVLAIEPVTEFLAAARSAYTHRSISWIKDSLPELRQLKSEVHSFDFILVDAVWHHLEEHERARALERFASLLTPRGRCALSLRNGPPGVGTHVFPTSARETIAQAHELGFVCIFQIEGQASHLPHKADVSWSRVVLEKAR